MFPNNPTPIEYKENKLTKWPQINNNESHQLLFKALSNQNMSNSTHSKIESSQNNSAYTQQKSNIQDIEGILQQTRNATTNLQNELINNLKQRQVDIDVTTQSMNRLNPAAILSGSRSILPLSSSSTNKTAKRKSQFR